jgi:hypothetical protein
VSITNPNGSSQAKGSQGKKEASNTFVILTLTTMGPYNVVGIKVGLWSAKDPPKPKPYIPIDMHDHHIEHLHLPPFGPSSMFMGYKLECQLFVHPTPRPYVHEELDSIK